MGWGRFWRLGKREPLQRQEGAGETGKAPRRPGQSTAAQCWGDRPRSRGRRTGPTCSSSRLCSPRRASIFPMTSWSRLRSSSMSRCWRLSLSCSAGGGPQGAHCPPACLPVRGDRTEEPGVPVPWSSLSCCRIPSSRSWEVLRCEASTREDSSCRLLENFSICSMMLFRDLEVQRAGGGAQVMKSGAPPPCPTGGAEPDGEPTLCGRWRWSRRRSPGPSAASAAAGAPRGPCASPGWRPWGAGAGAARGRRSEYPGQLHLGDRCSGQSVLRGLSSPAPGTASVSLAPLPLYLSWCLNATSSLWGQIPCYSAKDT